MTRIYKIVPEDLWRASERAGSFTGSPVDIADGFTAGRPSTERILATSHPVHQVHRSPSARCPHCRYRWRSACAIRCCRRS